MQDFASEFLTPEQYITDITHKIWEERGIGRIRDWYAPIGPVRTPHGVTESVEAVVQGTLETLHMFPDRELLAEDIIIGEKTEGFLSSHRVRSPATHGGAGAFGAATSQRITMLTIADCLCRGNQVVDEWLVRDQSSIAKQIGLDPVAFGRAMGENNPGAYLVGNEALCQRWADPDGLTVVGDEAIGNRVANVYDAIWNDKNLTAMDSGYDRALRFEGPTGYLCYGRPRATALLTTILASIPDGRYEPHHIIVREQEARPVRVALRWSYSGTHSGRGRYGEPTAVPLTLLGISHFELRDGLIVNEWMVTDETAIHAQIAAPKAIF